MLLIPVIPITLQLGDSDEKTFFFFDTFAMKNVQHADTAHH